MTPNHGISNGGHYAKAVNQVKLPLGFWLRIMK
jgi:hypothetical protein